VGRGRNGRDSGGREVDRGRDGVVVFAATVTIVAVVVVDPWSWGDAGGWPVLPDGVAATEVGYEGGVGGGIPGNCGHRGGAGGVVSFDEVNSCCECAVRRGVGTGRGAGEPPPGFKLVLRW